MVKIYGCSDDILSVVGDGLDEEFYPSNDHDDEPYRLALSDGSVFTVKYDGSWRISMIMQGTAKMTHEIADDTDPKGSRPGGEPWYSDLVTVHDPITWALGGTDFTSKGKRSAR